MIAHSPLHRSRRAGLPHRALASGDNAKPSQGIGMSNARRGQPALNEPPHPLPGESPPLPAPPQRAVPQSAHLKTERNQGRPVHRHPVVPQVSSDDRPQPRAHDWDQGMHASPQLGFDLAPLRRQPLPDRLPHHREPPIPLLPADMREAEEGERLRLPCAGPASVFGRAWLKSVRMDKREPSAVDPAAVVNRLACRSFLTLIGDSRGRQAPEIDRRGAAGRRSVGTSRRHLGGLFGRRIEAGGIRDQSGQGRAARWPA